MGTYKVQSAFEQAQMQEDMTRLELELTYAKATRIDFLVFGACIGGVLGYLLKMWGG